MAAWLLLAFFLFHMFTQSITFYTFYYHILKSTDVLKSFLFLSASFSPKFGLVFVLTLKNAFCQSFHFKPTERAQILLKSGTRYFQNRPPFQRSAYFYVTISGNFEQIQYFNFETEFLENKNLFIKLEYRFLVESTKIEST